MMRYTWVILAGLVVPVAAGGQAPDTTQADVVSLAFSWPVGMRASIDLERTKVRTTGNVADSSAIRVTYDLEVAAHRDGKLIRYSNFSAPGVTGLSDVQQRMVQAATSIVPSYVVSDDGQLVRIDQVRELRSSLVEWLHQAIGEPLSRDLEALMSQMLSEQALTGLANEQWNALVGTWAAAEVEVGAAYELEAEEPLPMLGNVLVPYRYELGASARVPCTRESQELDCVELILRSSPDPEALQPHLDAFVKRTIEAMGAGDKAPPISYKELSIENEIVVVTEPKTLIPHALTITRAVEAVMLVGGVEQVGAEHQIARHVFTYR